MEQDASVIQKDIEETRESLVDKIEALEQRVTGTVEEARSAVEETITSARSAVTDTVEAVKSTVTDTVESVKETFDLHRQVDRHPFLMVGGSVAAGFLTGRLVHGGGPNFGRMLETGYAAARSGVEAMGHHAGHAGTGNGAQHFASVPGTQPVSPDGLKQTVAGIASEVGQRFGHELDEVKRMALDAAVASIGGLAAKQFPMFADHIRDLTQHFRSRVVGGTGPSGSTR